MHSRILLHSSVLEKVSFVIKKSKIKRYGRAECKYDAWVDQLMYIDEDLEELDGGDTRRKPSGFVSRKGMKRFGLSCEDAQNKDQRKLRIKAATSSPRFTGKVIVKMACFSGISDASIHLILVKWLHYLRLRKTLPENSVSWTFNLSHFGGCQYLIGLIDTRAHSNFCFNRAI